MAERRQFRTPARAGSSTDGQWLEAARLRETGFDAEPAVRRHDGRLFAVPRRVPCRQCQWCGLGMADHCEQPSAVRPGELDSVVPLAERVQPEHAAFANVLARALRVARVVAPDDRALITLIGMDAQTLIAAQLLASVSNKVRVLAIDDADVERCDRWGIRHRPVAAAGLRNDQDVVVLGRTDANGLGLMPEVLPGMVRPRGRIIVTESASGSGLGVEAVGTGEFLISGVRGGCLHEAAAMLASGTCPDLAGLGFEVRRGGPGRAEARFGVVVVNDAA